MQRVVTLAKKRKVFTPVSPKIVKEGKSLIIIINIICKYSRQEDSLGRKALIKKEAALRLDYMIAKCIYDYGPIEAISKQKFFYNSFFTFFIISLQFIIKL